MDAITTDKLHQLKLTGMLEALAHIQQSPPLHTLTFEQGLTLLVDSEITQRANKRLKRLLKNAKLRYTQASVEEIYHEHKRAIKHEQWQWLIRGQWLKQHQNILLIGPTGIGKTYLACACAQLACRQSQPTRYFRLSKLLQALSIAQADGSYTQLINQLLKIKCLVIDDWGIEPITPNIRAPLLEIIDDAYDQRSLIIATQLPIEQWHDYIGDTTIADAILDRIIHQAQILKLSGDSMRGNTQKLDST